jgi:uncharacterized protein
MTLDTPTLSPLAGTQRISSIDVLRGVSLLGILLMNIVGFGLPREAYANPSIGGGDSGLNFGVWLANSLFIEGTMRAIFSMLFGAGVLIFTSKAEEKGAGIATADLYYRRTIWLIVFGIAHAYLLLWTGEILYAYGVMGLLLFPMRRLAPKTLILAACCLLTIGVLLDYNDYRNATQLQAKAGLATTALASGESLSPELQEADKEWTKTLAKHNPSQQEIDKNIAGMQGSYWETFFYLVPINRHSQSYIMYRYDLWDVFSMMLLGMAFLKLNIVNASKSYRFYGGMLLLGYGIGIPINYHETSLLLSQNFSYLAFKQAGITYELGRLFTVLGHVGLIMLFCKLPLLAWFKHSLAAVGRMAFTNYILHTLICNFIFLGIGLGLYGQLERFELYYVVAGIWIFQLALSPLWLHYFRFGPLEWAWRSLTYQQLQPFRKQKPQPEPVLQGVAGA